MRKTYEYTITDLHDGVQLNGEVEGACTESVRQQLFEIYCKELDTEPTGLKVDVRVKKEQPKRNFRDYSKEVKDKAQQLTGFINGYSFDELIKGETVYIFQSKRPLDELELIQTTIKQCIKEKNAQGKDVIRKIVVDIDGVDHYILGHAQIKNHIFKKDESLFTISTVANENFELMGETVSIEEKFEDETMVIERAMSPKNPTVKKYIEDGWEWVGKEWSGERNMYLATLKKVN